MKKTLITMLALIAMLSVATPAFGAELKDFDDSKIAYHDELFKNELGEYRVLYDENGTGKTTDEIFSEGIQSMPKEIVELYNNYGGKIEFVNNLFQLYEGSPYYGGCYWYDLGNIRLSTGWLTPSSDCYYHLRNTAAADFAHEIGHFVMQKTEPYWSSEDRAAFAELLREYEASGMMPYIKSLGYRADEYEREAFAHLFQTVYGDHFVATTENTMFSQEIFDFLGRINVIAANLNEKAKAEVHP